MFYTRVVLVALFMASVALASEVSKDISEAATAAAAQWLRSVKKTYKGYQLIRATPESEKHLQVLRFFENSVGSNWTPIPLQLDSEMKLHVGIMFNPEEAEHLKYILECSAIPYEESLAVCILNII